MYEVKALMDYGYYAYKDQWESARLISWIVAQVNSKNKIKPTDIMAFYWEDATQEVASTAISDADIERLREQANQFITNNTEINGK